MLNSHNRLHFDQPCDNVLHVQIDEPDPQTTEETLIADFNELWQELQQPDDSLRCIIVSGSKHGLQLITTEQASQCTDQLNSLLQNMQECALPIITCLQGCIDQGGTEMSLMSDIVLTTRNTQFHQLKHQPTTAIKQLDRLVGLRRAKQLVLTGESFDAKQALSWGLINDIATIKTLLPSAIALSQQVVKHQLSLKTHTLIEA